MTNRWETDGPSKTTFLDEEMDREVNAPQEPPKLRTNRKRKR